MNEISQRAVLKDIARKAMIERGFNTEFPETVLKELENISLPDSQKPNLKDLRHYIWCSIDNVESRDLDQLQYAEQLPDGKIRVLVAIADVDTLVKASSIIDLHAAQNTTSVYTPGWVFSMLPEKLSTELTSLNPNVDRYSIVIEMIVATNGSVCESDVYCAVVHNYAKLDYDSVGEWLEEKMPMPEAITKVDGLAENIRLQDKAGRLLRQQRFERGALDFNSSESRPEFDGDKLVEIKSKPRNPAKNMVEDFMITCNQITAKFLASRNLPSLRRVVRTPKRWDRIVELAAEHNFSLPEKPDPKALSDCFKYVKQNMPEHFSDLTFSVLKLIGGGEYLLQLPNEPSLGHFGLAVKNYSHSTAPNRRYPDLITHRLLKAAMDGGEIPYTNEQLEVIAKNCTVKEDEARKVERQVEKSAYAMLLKNRIGEKFCAMVSGAAPKGTWVKLMEPQIEGKLVKGFENLKVGNKLIVKLLSVNIESGFIDFERID